MFPQFRAEHGDVTQVPSDLLLLKHATDFYGVDRHVADVLARAGRCSTSHLRPGPDHFVVVPTNGVMAPQRVMYLGTPPLAAFSYGQMRHFAARFIEIAAGEYASLKRITTVIHGVGYGLDAVESLHSLIRGFTDALATWEMPSLEEIVFVDRNERRARTLAASLDTAQPGSPRRQTALSGDTRSGTMISPTSGRANLPASSKRHVFVAMPYAEEFEDVYEFGIYGPVRQCGLICERVDQSVFTGDILQRIRQRIETADLVIAELTGARPNVYLEVGYAWGKGIPVIFVARDGEEPHFDVKVHRCLYYRTIKQLASDLDKLIRGLLGPGSGSP